MNRIKSVEILQKVRKSVRETGIRKSVRDIGRSRVRTEQMRLIVAYKHGDTILNLAMI